MKLQCEHKAKFRLEFFCQTGNYIIELCKKCRESEPNDFLVREEKIS